VLVANGESTAKARGNGAASGRRFARTVYQRLRAGLNCVAPTALKEALAPSSFGTAEAVPDEVHNARAGWGSA
jgi:hypothetical protein